MLKDVKNVKMKKKKKNQMYIYLTQFVTAAIEDLVISKHLSEQQRRYPFYEQKLTRLLQIKQLYI